MCIHLLGEQINLELMGFGGKLNQGLQYNNKEGGGEAFIISDAERL